MIDTEIREIIVSTKPVWGDYMGKQMSKNLRRILTLFIVAILIASVGVAFGKQDHEGDHDGDQPVKMDFDGGSSFGDWFGHFGDLTKGIGKISEENKTHDRGYNGGHDNGGPGYGGPGYGGALVPMPMYGGSPMMGSPMYGNEPSISGSEPSTTAVPNSEPNVCKGKVSSSKCHKDKCALSKHKHKNHSKKHKAEKNC